MLPTGDHQLTSALLRWLGSLSPFYTKSQIDPPPADRVQSPQEKKHRSCTRARRRARKPSAHVDPIAPGHIAEQARWVRPLASASPRWGGSGYGGAEMLVENGGDIDGAATCHHNAAPATTPSRHLLPVSLFSPATRVRLNMV
ncbi:unnamed protein product [Scytosiphon promiscuus]